MEQSWRKAEYPSLGDSISESFEQIAARMLVVTPADSIPAARSILSTAEIAGEGPTPDRPAFFDVGGIIYRSDGTKSAAGVWRLSPVNEIERDSQTADDISRVPVAASTSSTYITSQLPARPYDRFVLGFGQVNGFVQTGRVSLVCRIGSTLGMRAPLDTETGPGAEGVTSINVGLIPAGQSPDIRLAFLGSGSNQSTVSTSGGRLANRFDVIAFPITMGI